MKKLSHALAALAAATFATSAYADAEPFTLPAYLEPTQEEFGRFTILDNNHDGKTWTWLEAESGIMRYTYHSGNVGDDWAFIPITLTESDKALSFSVQYKNTSGWAEKFEIGIGTAATPEAMTIAGEQDVPNQDWETMDLIIPNNVVGTGYIGIHAISEPNQYLLDLRTIKIIPMSLPVPMAPTISDETVDFVNYSATLTMPTKDIFGDDLPEGTAMTLVCDVTDMEPMAFTSQPGGEVAVDFTSTPGKKTISYIVSYEYNGETLTSGVLKREVKFIRVPGVFTLPFSMAPTEEDFEECNVIDNNNDNSTWTFNEEKGAFKYSYNNSNPGDDYLMLPGIATSGVGSIKVEFKIWAESTSFGESMEVLMGTVPNPEEMVDILDITGFAVTNATPFEVEKELPAGCEQVYLAFHAVSNANMYYLWLKDINVTATSEVKVGELMSANAIVKGMKGGISLEGINGEARILTTDGKVAASIAENDAFISLAKGLYIVEINGKAIKAIVR